MSDADDSRAMLNPDERKALKGMLGEMTLCLQRIDNEKEHMSDIAAACQEKFGVKKKFINKLAKVMYNHTYADVTAENEHFEHLYESIVESSADGSPSSQD